MRKSKQEASETRQRIVETAAAEFRRGGIEGTGLSDLMAAAGLTHGGFYRHFASKDDLVAEACAAALEAITERIAATATGKVGQRGLSAVVTRYLSTDHRDHPADGCALAALGSELARSSDRTRAAATEGYLKLVAIVTAQLDSDPPDVARARALAAVSTMIGALTMSRIATDPDLSAAILESAAKELTARR
jgi:TetR/AcrR family transcriptional regulator, transcriptional repressor for nem operon